MAIPITSLWNQLHKFGVKMTVVVAATRNQISTIVTQQQKHPSGKGDNWWLVGSYKMSKTTRANSIASCDHMSTTLWRTSIHLMFLWPWVRKALGFVTKASCHCKASSLDTYCCTSSNISWPYREKQTPNYPRHQHWEQKNVTLYTKSIKS